MDHYGTEEAFRAWGQGTGSTIPNGAVVPALVRASAYIDGVYGPRFVGVKAGGFEQELAWPRTGAITADGFFIPPSVVPLAVERATYEAAIRELQSPGSLLPDFDVGTVIKREKVGPIETEYAVPVDAKAARPVFGVIDGLLLNLLAPRLPAVLVI